MMNNSMNEIQAGKLDLLIKEAEYDLRAWDVWSAKTKTIQSSVFHVKA